MPRAKKGNRKDKRYQIARTIGYNTDGKAIKKSFYGKNKDEAIQKYHEYKLGIEKENGLKKQMPIEVWIEKWLYTYKEKDVKETTFNSTYKRPCKIYIIPYFTGRFIQNITQADIKEFLNTLTNKSQSLIDKIIICLRGIFETAVDNDIIIKNPCRNISIKSKAIKEKKRTYDKESVEALCKTNHKYSLYIKILLKMGLRCSELCGLRWTDINFEEGTMHIKQALTADGSKIYIDKPKSINSTRKLKIPPALLDELKNHPKEDEYIAVINGHHITPNSFGDIYIKAFYNALKIPKEQRLSPHMLRHTCGTLLYRETKDIYFVSRFLGHSDIGITTKTYVHSEMQDEEIHLNLEI
ncbi:MAG: site-specific integrase [Clostridia bacterium]|nr:site-specific integrase [Clostridia bacterium]